MIENTRHTRPGRFEILALLAILLLAGALRLVESHLVEFKLDEANLSQLSLDFARGRSLPLLGISSSVGFPNSPVSVYIFSLPYAFTSDPTVATQFVGLLNVFAVLLTYILTRCYYGTWPALLAALLYAVSPWGIIYSRKIWAQDVLPPFVVLTMLAGLAGFVDGKRWGQWLCLPLLAFTAQIHYSGAVLLLPVAYLFVTGRKRWTRAFFMSFIPATLVCMPFIVGLLKADLPSVSEIQTFISSGAGDSVPRSVGLTGETLHYAALMIAGTEIHSLASESAYQNYLARVPDVYFLFGLLAWGVLFSSLWLLFRAWRGRDFRAQVDGFLLLWFITPVAVFSVTWTTPHLHYLIVMMPVPYIILAAGLRDGWNVLRSRIVVRRLVIVGVGTLLGGIIIFQVVLWLALVSFLKTDDPLDTFGIPLGARVAVRDEILFSHPTQVIARLDGQFVGLNEDATVWNVLLDDISEVRFVDDSTDVFPASESILLTYCDESVGVSNPADGLCYQTADRSPDDAASIRSQPLTANTTFANGAVILGYDWSTEALPCLTLVWSITAPADRDYMFAVHFTNADGVEFLNTDGLSWSGKYWRPGDTVVRTFCLSEDQALHVAEIAGVNIGMYTYDGTNFGGVDVLDENGTPVGQTISIRLNS